MPGLRDEFDVDNQAPPESDSGHWVLSLLTFIASALVLVYNVFGQEAWWFRALVALFALAALVWMGSTLRPKAAELWAKYRDGRRLRAHVRILYPEFQDVVNQFRKYANTNRSDTIPYFLRDLSQRQQISLPIHSGGVYFPLRFYEGFRKRVPDSPPTVSEFQSLLEDFRDLMQLYHDLYVTWPYETLRTQDQSRIPQQMRVELDGLREDYNTFLRNVQSFGDRVVAAF